MKEFEGGVYTPFINCAVNPLMNGWNSNAYLVYVDFHRFPRPALPAFKYFSLLAGDAFAISIVGFAASVSQGIIFATKHGYEIHSNQVSYLEVRVGWNGR